MPKFIHMNNIEILSALPANVYWHDLDNIYRGCNAMQLKSLGLQYSDIIGKDMSRVLSAFTPDYAEIADNDLKVMAKQKEFIYFESAIVAGKAYNYISKKVPLYDANQQLIGLFGLSVDITSQQSRKHKEWLIDSMDNRLFSRSENPTLTKRQQQCLYYVIRGYSARDIGTMMGLSKRTIEMHIDILKDKFYCSKKSELINKVISQLS